MKEGKTKYHCFNFNLFNAKMIKDTIEEIVPSFEDIALDLLPMQEGEDLSLDDVIERLCKIGELQIWTYKEFLLDMNDFAFRLKMWNALDLSCALSFLLILVVLQNAPMLILV